MEEEPNCFFICLQGIVKNGDIYGKRATETFEAIRAFPQDRVPRVNVEVDFIGDFVSKMYMLERPILLISGSGDYTVPKDMFPSTEAFYEFVNHPLILHYFVQNAWVWEPHPKMTKMPIGIDYHTEARRGETPKKQERDLISVCNMARPFYERKCRAYSNFHFADYGNMFGYSRQDVIRDVPAECVYYEPRRVSRMESWKNNIEYAFTISPFGHGMDCHRTWEAFVLGSIVIVQKSPLDELYRDLPVLIVDKWSDITPELLAKTMADYSQKRFDMKRITLQYWVSLFRDYPTGV